MAVLLARLFGLPPAPEAAPPPPLADHLSPLEDGETQIQETGIRSSSRSRPRSSTDVDDRIGPLPVLPAPYDTPDPSGRCWLVELPEEVLVKVFMGLDRVSLARSMRVSHIHSS